MCRLCVCVSEMEKEETRQADRQILLEWCGEYNLFSLLEPKSFLWSFGVPFFCHCSSWVSKCFFIVGGRCPLSVSRNHSLWPASVVMLSNTWQPLVCVVTSFWCLTVAWPSLSLALQLCLLLWECWHGWKSSQRGCPLNCQRLNGWHWAQVLLHKCFGRSLLNHFPINAIQIYLVHRWAMCQPVLGLQ